MAGEEDLVDSLICRDALCRGAVMMVWRSYSRALIQRLGWSVAFILLSTGFRCESSDEAVDAATDAEAQADSGGVDAAPSCTELVDGGAVEEVACPLDAGTEDGGETWYDLDPCPPPELDDTCTVDCSKCLSHLDHCSVFYGTTGDTVCVRIGMGGGGPAFIPPPSVEIVGDCVELREIAEPVVVESDCGADCLYWSHHLYELVEGGDCTLQIEAHLFQEQETHIHVRVLE
jgi:hypothetical protein